MLHWYVSPSILSSTQSFRLVVHLHKGILLLEHHNTITDSLDWVTTVSQIEKDPSGIPQWPLSLPSARTSMFLTEALRSQGSRKKKLYKEEQIMRLSFIDLIIMASVILCVVVFLLLLNWMSKQGDR
jgi:hypothetical protein